MWTEELFAKAFRSFETYVLVNNNFCRKLFSSLESPKIFDEKFKSCFSSIFIADFNLLSFKLGNYIFNMLYWVILY